MAKTDTTAASTAAETLAKDLGIQGAETGDGDAGTTAELQAALGIEPVKEIVGADLTLSAAYTANSAVEIDPAQCPRTHICMFCAGGYRRIALTTGRVYVFVDGKPQFVHKEDRSAVAAQGGAEYTK